MLDVLNLSKSFGGIDALSDISFSIKNGEIVSIIGPNGAGKTTLFNIITGLIQPSKGAIFFNGCEIIPDNSIKELNRVKIASYLILLYSIFITLFFYFSYINYTDYHLEFTLFLAISMIFRIFAVYRFYQKVLWAKAFLSLILFFDAAFLIYIAVKKIFIMPVILITIFQMLFYIYLHRKPVKNIFGEFLEAEKISIMGIARTFQNIRLFGNLKVIENIMIGFHNSFKGSILDILFNTDFHNKEEKAFRDKAFNLLEYTGIKDQAYNLASNLSYGEQRKLEIARALSLNPKLILLDEPAAGMNNMETLQLIDLIKKIRESGTTVLLIEHDMNFVMNISDRVIVLNYGKKIAEGTPIDIRQNQEVIKAYLGDKKGD